MFLSMFSCSIFQQIYINLYCLIISLIFIDLVYVNYIMEMETDSLNYEPPTKASKIDVQQYPSLYVKLHLTGLFDIQKAQSVIRSEPSTQRDATPLLFRQMAFNLGFVAITEEEYIMINKSIREILHWKPQKIPYLQLFVKNSLLRRAILNRSSMLLASFAELPPCCIGIRIVANKRNEEYMQKHHVTVLRRIIWNFILTELDPIPPHVRMFLATELKFIANQDIPTTPVTSSDHQTMANKKPQKSQVKTLS